MSIGTVGRIALGAAAGLGLGAAVHVGTRSVVANLNEGIVDKRYAEIAEERANVQPGKTAWAFPVSDDGQGYAEAFIPAISGMAGIVGVVGGLYGIPGKPLLSIAAAAGGGLGLGVASGIFAGLSRGEKASDARHGVDVVDQAAHVVDAYDHNGSGALEISYANRATPEFTHPVAGSIESFARAADADGDLVVTTAEVQAQIGAFDLNGDGRISKGPESEAMSDARMFVLTRIG